MKIKKNRNRGQFSFANINLLGKCNADCYFCLGKDIRKELQNKNQLNIHFESWNNFDSFLIRCYGLGIRKLYLTGQNADPLQYKYLDDLIDYLKRFDFYVGIRTNGLLAEKKILSIQKLNGEVGYSIHTLSTTNNNLIMKTKIPNWLKIIPMSGNNVRVSVVLGKYNFNNFIELMKFISQFKNVKYIQIRRISTETRLKEFQEDILVFEKFYDDFIKKHKQSGEYCLGQKFELFGKEIVFWRTVETNCNSINYFTDGTISNEYFIIEGYLKNITIPRQLHGRVPG